MGDQNNDGILDATNPDEYTPWTNGVNISGDLVIAIHSLGEEAGVIITYSSFIGVLTDSVGQNLNDIITNATQTINTTIDSFENSSSTTLTAVQNFRNETETFRNEVLATNPVLILNAPIPQNSVQIAIDIQIDDFIGAVAISSESVKFERAYGNPNDANQTICILNQPVANSGSILRVSYK